MSTTPDLPTHGSPDSTSTDDAMFEELAARAGAALRSPAPAGGVDAISARGRRQQTGKAVLVGCAAIALVAAAVVIASSRDNDLRSPVDSAPDELTPTTAENVPTAVDAAPSLWVDVQPGATAALPPAPISAHYGSSLVWTGSELIVWGGVRDDRAVSEAREGAAFDPVTGTWRVIAPPPPGVAGRLVLWTGEEMQVWSNGGSGRRSAAYNPATDTWRTLANPPTHGAEILWTGDATIFMGDVAVPGGTVPGIGYVYDPAVDEWRRLADGSWSSNFVWTGSTIVFVTDTSRDTGTKLAGYDPATDTWHALESVDSGLAMVRIPGEDGEAATVAVMPQESGDPIVLLDDRGNSIGEWAARPADLPSTCEGNEGNPDVGLCLFAPSPSGVLVGGEVVWWDRGDAFAYDVDSQTWRAFPLDGRQPTSDGTEVIAVGDLLFVWGAERDGLVYRAP